MNLKKQLINYFESNKYLAGNLIFFNELPSEKIITKKVQLSENSQFSNEKLQKIEIQNVNINQTEKNTIESQLLEKSEVTEEKNMSKKTKQNDFNVELPDLSTYNSLEELNTEVQNCQNCILGSTRKNLVFGSGNPNADILVIGEAPGADEDEQGLPFVGRAGKLLTDILKAVNFSRDEVYIANICKCRPPGNRKPTELEVYCCETYLKKQIDLIKPKFILALGLTAAEALFKKSFKMAETRGNLLNYHEIPTLVTYHPAALLRNPAWKRPVWEDVQLLRKLYNEYLEKEK
jgi:DNA polymerase